MSTCTSSARVLIVESLSPYDLLEGYREARATADVLRTLGVKTVLAEARSPADFDAACGMFSSGAFDVLHLACHGSANHLVLTDGTEIPWRTFARKLGTGIHDRHLVMSMCHGGCDAVPKIFAEQSSRPKAILGPRARVDWTDLVVAWQVYYKAVLPCSENESDDPCVAVSRVHMATGADIVCYQWEDGAYLPYSSCPSCAYPVVLKTYPDFGSTDIIALAELVAPELLGEEGQDREDSSNSGNVYGAL